MTEDRIALIKAYTQNVLSQRPTDLAMRDSKFLLDVIENRNIELAAALDYLRQMLDVCQYNLDAETEPETAELLDRVTDYLAAYRPKEIAP